MNELILNNVIAYSGNGHHSLGAKALFKFGEYAGIDMTFQHTNFSDHPDGEPDNTPNKPQNIAGKVVIHYQSMYTMALMEESLDAIWAYKKQYKAAYVIGVFPFLIFRRQDHPEKFNEVYRLRMIIDRLAHAGLDEMIVVTPHSNQMKKCCDEFGIKFTAVDMSNTFAEVLSTYLPDNNSNIIVHAPDEGSIYRAIKLAKALKVPVYFNVKDRGMNNVIKFVELDETESDVIVKRVRQLHQYEDIHYAYADSVKDKTIVMIDDEVSTGSTANENARSLKEFGAKQIFFVVTHPVLTSGWRKKLLHLNPFDKIIMATTIPRDYSKSTGGYIYDISVSSQLGSALFKSVSTYVREKYNV